MSTKRTATSELNHENWDQEDPTEEEEMGSFKAASKDVLEKRVIRTAKRRTQASGDEAKKSVFSGFGGFNKAQPSSFDFLANLTNGSKNTNGTSTKSDTAVTSSLFSSKPAPPTGGLFGINPPSTMTPQFGTLQTSPFASSAKTEIPSMTFTASKADSTVSDSPFKIQSVSSSGDTITEKRTTATVSSTIFGVSSTSTNQTKSLTTNTSPFKQPVSSTSTAVQNSATQSNASKNEAANDKPETEREKARNKYYSKLKGLNESVSSWIVKHVEKTPLCFLTPIFKDYENYLKDIQAEYEAAKLKEETMAKEAQNKPDTSNASPVQSSAFGGTNTGSLFSNSSKSLPLKTNDANAANTSAGFSFGITSTNNSITASTSNTLSTTTPTKGFSFGTSNTATLQTKSTSTFAITTSTTTSTPSKGFAFGITPSTNTTTSSTNSSAFATTADKVTDSPSKGFSFGSATTATSPTTSSLFATTNAGKADTPPSKGFSFGITSTPSASTLTNSATGAAPFSFGIGSGTPFTLGSQTQQQNAESEPPKNDEEEDQPPKVEYTPVVEENSVFDKRCKIFVKKDGNFVDKGVGTLYIKKIEESGKHQLLVRANTNLGTVLLNLILASAIPTQRMGKNNVMLACIPTPDAKPPPTPVLIRVKTGEEADDLLETLNKYKS